jgi:hypothetical protein
MTMSSPYRASASTTDSGEPPPNFRTRLPLKYHAVIITGFIALRGLIDGWSGAMKSLTLWCLVFAILAASAVGKRILQRRRARLVVLGMAELEARAEHVSAPAIEPAYRSSL